MSSARLAAVLVVFTAPFMVRAFCCGSAPSKRRVTHAGAGDDSHGSDDEMEDAPQQKGGGKRGKRGKVTEEFKSKVMDVLQVGPLYLHCCSSPLLNDVIHEAIPCSTCHLGTYHLITWRLGVGYFESRVPCSQLQPCRWCRGLTLVRSGRPS